MEKFTFRFMNQEVGKVTGNIPSIGDTIILHFDGNEIDNYKVIEIQREYGELLFKDKNDFIESGVFVILGGI